MLKTINIVTTASLPWRTGTAILALFRAYHLAQRGLDVTLYIPWIPKQQQSQLFGEDQLFDHHWEQEAYLRGQLPDFHGDNLQFVFYPARYFAALGSILPSAPIAPQLCRCDWLILEEPEHLNWKHPWNRYRDRAKRVTGIVLTNYRFFIRQAVPAITLIPWLMARYNRWLMQHHCDELLLLGEGFPAMEKAQPFVSSGVPAAFFAQQKVEQLRQGVYFIGKIIWEKGFRELVDLLCNSEVNQMDIYGLGKDQQAIRAYAKGQKITFNFKGATLNPAEELAPYKLFINTSRSECHCSTTAEALAHGKFVLIPDCASNESFRRFKNALLYTSAENFQIKLSHAMAHQPEEDDQLTFLSWQAATDRLLAYHAQRVYPDIS
uniref:Putative GT4: related to digalactosyldiacylglycerol synthase n=1 Tax=Magnetococcus massalia (strain MO-1) TaxID=451514 RepID=A0A1S7LJI0_MAGMO|nr:putative GT4 : related to digalactosyldiacylglycerol synthase [Candidatus Magnetococcus massalia]